VFVLKGREATVRLNGLTFSHDGALLAACGEHGEARAWDVASRACIAAPPQSWSVVAAFFGAGDRELFVLNGYTKGLQMCPLPRGAMSLIGHCGLVAPAPDGGRVYCCPHNTRRELACHLLPSFSRTWSTGFAGVKGELVGDASCLHCSADGARLACGHANGRVSVLDAATGAWLHRVGDAGSPGGARAVAISPDGKALAWCAASHLHFRRLPPEEVRAHHRLGRTHFLSVAWHSSGDFFATGNGDGKVDFWDGHTGQARASFDWGVGKLHGVAFDPDGDRAAACSHTGQVVVWDVDR
jgi:WD40 repeat protein